MADVPRRQRGTSPLRIGYLISSLVAAGGERQMVALAERLPAEEFRIDFLARTGPGPLDDRARAAGARVHHLASLTSHETSPLRRQAARGRRFTSLVSIARQERYDIIDAWLYPADVLAAVTRPLTRVPVIMSGRLNIAPRHSVGPMSRTLDRLASRQTDAVVAICQAVADFAVSVHGVDPAKLHIIRNGVEPGPHVSEEERQRLRARLGGSASDFLIGCVGNYREMKGQILLVRAFAPLAAQRPDLRLVLIGEGPTRSEIEREVRALGLGDRVRVHGLELDILPFYAALDLVVQASRSEGLPNVLLEASAAGRPIVATAAGGSGEVVIDGTTGLLVPVDDEAALTRALRRAIEDPDLRARMATAAREQAMTTYGMDRFVTEWADLYRRLATGVPRPGRA